MLQASDISLDVVVTAEPPKRATNEQVLQQSISQRAAVKYFEAVSDDGDLLQRVERLMSEMVQSMDSADAGADDESFTVWSDIICQELLDTRFLSSEVRDAVRFAGHATIMRSINESLQRATAGELDGCVSISHLHSRQSSGDTEALAREVLSGSDSSVLRNCCICLLT